MLLVTMKGLLLMKRFPLGVWISKLNFFDCRSVASVWKVIEMGAVFLPLACALATRKQVRIRATKVRMMAQTDRANTLCEGENVFSLAAGSFYS